MRILFEENSRLSKPSVDCQMVTFGKVKVKSTSGPPLSNHSKGRTNCNARTLEDSFSDGVGYDVSCRFNVAPGVFTTSEEGYSYFSSRQNKLMSGSIKDQSDLKLVSNKESEKQKPVLHSSVSTGSSELGLSSDLAICVDCGCYRVEDSCYSSLALATAHNRRVFGFNVVPRSLGASAHVVEILPFSLDTVDSVVRKKMEGVVNPLFTMLYVFGMKADDALMKSVESSYDNTLKHWIKGALACGPSGWMKFAKYKLAAFFHYHTHQMDVGPERPFTNFSDLPGHLCSGIADRFISKLLMGPRRYEFLASVCQLKKGCTRPDQTELDREAVKTKTELCSTRPEVVAPLHYIPHATSFFKSKKVKITREIVQNQLQRTVDEIFRGKKYTVKHRTKGYLPSFSATIDNSREAGGGMQDVYNFACKKGILERNRNEVNTTRVKLVQPKLRRVLTDDEWGKPCEDYYECRSPDRGLSYQIDSKESDAVAASLYWQLLKHCRTYESINCVPVALPEALKIRVITAGDGFVNHLLKPLQVFLLGCVSEHECFKLTGEEITEEIVNQKIGKLLGGEYLNSGDYSAATNNLAPWVSEYLCDAISKHIGLADCENKLFKLALTGHRFWPDRSSYRDFHCHNMDDEISEKQKWGQLMGSVVSFPLLCIANFAISRWCLEMGNYGRSDMPCYNESLERSIYSVDTCPMLINGDDIAFRATMPVYKLWKSATAFIGLTMSVGKSFLSREFLQMNSTNFIYKHSETEDERYSLTKFVNFGLLYGMKRSGSKVGIKDIVAEAGDQSIGARHRELMARCPPYLRERVHQFFLIEHKEVLEKLRLPWYIHESWGGVGLATVETEEYTEEEVRAGRYKNFVIDSDEGEIEVRVQVEAPVFERYYRYGPTRKDMSVIARMWDHPELQAKQLPAAGSIHLHRLVMDATPFAEFVEPSAIQQRQWSSYYSRACFDIALTYVSDISTRDLIEYLQSERDYYDYLATKVYRDYLNGNSATYNSGNFRRFSDDKTDFSSGEEFADYAVRYGAAKGETCTPYHIFNGQSGLFANTYKRTTYEWDNELQNLIVYQQGVKAGIRRTMDHGRWYDEDDLGLESIHVPIYLKDKDGNILKDEKGEEKVRCYKRKRRSQSLLKNIAIIRKNEDAWKKALRPLYKGTETVVQSDGTISIGPKLVSDRLPRPALQSWYATKVPKVLMVNISGFVHD